MAILWALTVATMALSPEKTSVQSEVQRARKFRQNGLIAGGALLTSSIAIGTSANIIEPNLLVAPTVAAALLVGRNVKPQVENAEAMVDSAFEVKKSTIPEAGKGLFASGFIPKDTYLFDYEGEILTENEYFSRYPYGEGRYVAEIPGAFIWQEPIYIDGANAEKSNLARYMNSLPTKQANVIWKKQRTSTKSGRMSFYSSCEISLGEELCFDYGEQYWGAVINNEKS